MPGMSGLDAMIAIRNEFPDAKFIVLTTLHRRRAGIASDQSDAFMSL
jgi:DNA-binding NarL/FixJ family response regulator